MQRGEFEFPLIMRNMKADGESINPLVYWASKFCEHPELVPLRSVVTSVFGVPATSSAIERVFSQSGIASALRRNRTGLELFNLQLVPYINIHLYKLL